MKKKVLCLVLCLLMFISVMSFGVSAANSANANIVHQVSILDVCAPYAEYYPDYDFTLGLPAAYTFDTDRVDSGACVYNGCWWYDETDKTPIDYDDAFIKGHTYKLIVLLETNDGYEFQVDNFNTPFIKGYVNGKAAVIDDSFTSKYTACVEYTFAPSDYNMEVETVKLTVTEPETGNCPDFSARTDRSSVKVTPETAGYHIEGVSWYDYKTHTYLDPSDTFAEDGVYEVNVRIETTGDFYFSTDGRNPDVEVFVNGKKATASYVGKDINHYLLVSFAFGDVYQEISKVEITNTKAPAEGANPIFDATARYDAYYVNGVFWTDITTSNEVTLKESDTFKAGHTYELQVWLRTNDGYKFRIDEDEYIDIVAYINGQEAEVSEAGNEIAAILYMEFTIPESRVISEVEVINVDTPYAGRTPDYDAFCITRGCNVSSVKWYDVTDGSYVLMGEDDTFVEGHRYRVNVMVEAEGNYTFLMVDRYNEAGGYINGVRAIAAAADEDTWLQLGYIFAPVEKDPSKIISEFEIYDIEAPVAGNLPDTDAFAMTPGCEVAEVKWYDFTDGTHVPVAENTPFVEGRIYRVVVTVEAGAGYTFLMIDGYNEAEGYIDRTKAMSYGSHDDFLLDIALEFALCEADPNKPAVTGLLGDADCDTKVNIKDATAIQKHVASLITLSETGLALADVDASGNVNIKDATAIQKYIAGIETGYPIDKPIA